MAMLTPEQEARVKRNIERTEYPPEYEMKSGLRKVVWYIVRALMVLFRIETIGAEKIPQQGPVLLCANHVSYLDIPLIHLTINRWTWWVARESLFKTRFAARFMPWWGAIPLDVNNPSASSIKTIIQYLKEGKMLGIFPQGTRCKSLEKLRNTPPKSGAVSFAIRNDAYIVPVAIDGTFKLFGKTRAIIGDPYKIDVQGKKKLTEEELMTHSIQLMENIFSLMGKEYPLNNKSELTGGRISD